MKIYVIYKVTNKINGKIYIGFTGDFDARKAKHKKNAESDKPQAIYQAIRKYGWHNFTWEVICCSKDKDYMWNVMEDYFINLYDSMNPKIGYNMMKGGKCGILSEESCKKISQSKLGKPRSPETIEKIRQSQKGRKISPEQIEKLSIAQNKRYESNPSPLKGRKLTEDHKKAISEGSTHWKHTDASKNKIRQANSKTWLITFPDGHNEQITSLNKFCMENGLHISAMSKLASGKIKYLHKGFSCRKL